MKPARRWLVWGGVAVAVVALGVVGGPFIYIHFIEGKAPAPLTLAPGPTTTVAAAAPAASSPAGAAAGLDGTWKIATGSQAGYRVKETLFGQSNTAVGRTSAVTGTLAISAMSVTAAQFRADLTTVRSDQDQRDRQFQGRIMNTSSFPTATFTLATPIQFGAVPAAGAVVTASATGDLNLHGVTKRVTFSVQGRQTGSAIGVSGSIPVVFADYHIDNPSGGPASTDSSGTLEFSLNFERG